jgi:hypothetical protein
MNKKTLFTILIVVSMVTMISAQGWRQNRANRYHTLDVTAPVEITGKIVKVETTANTKGRRGTGTHLTVADGGKKYPVSLGPTAYLDSHKWNFQEGENVKLKVFKGTGNNSGAFYAAEINRGDRQLVLRDTSGLPMWRASLNKRGGSRGGRGGGRGAGRYYNQ